MAAVRARRPAVDPTLEVERGLIDELGGSGVVVGLDEVGRGALAGPVVVGACAVRFAGGEPVAALPVGVRDSKALTARRREALVAPIGEAAHAHGLGWASAAEIDEHGIMEALTLAALRALDALGCPVDAIVLDGSADVLSGRLAAAAPGAVVPRVTLRVGADRDCTSVAAASVLAKVARDARMVELSRSAPDYRWDANKGYGAAAHREAIERCGVHEEHRRSWNLGVRTAPRADVLWSADVAGAQRAPGARPDPQEATR